MQNKKWEEVGVVGVDAGLMWLGDPCYIMGKDANEHPVETWAEFCEKIENLTDAQQFNYKMGHAGLGVCISGFGGDGTYPVLIKKNADGLVTEVKIIFNEEE